MLEKFLAFQIATEYYWKCNRLKVPRFLQEQLWRASSSIALNLAEGSGKRTPPADQRKFYTVAFGSLRECQAILALEKITDKELLDLGNQLGAILYTLSRKTLPETKNRTETESATDTAADNSSISIHPRH